MRRPRIWLQAARLSVLVGLFLNGLAYRVWAAPVSSLIERFQECVPDREILLTLAGDCDADGIEDLVVMYRENENENRMVAVYSSNGNFLVSEWTRAPLENYRMQWRDIDERPPVELLVSGQKGIHIGFAVFRFVEGKWISLFGEGMEDCC